MVKNKTVAKLLEQEILENTNLLPKKYKEKVIPTSWIPQAIELLRFLNLYLVNNNKLQDMEGIIGQKNTRKVQVSFLQLRELNEVLKAGTKVVAGNEVQFYKRITKVILMPLLPEDENSNTNEGRNFLFELLLFTSFANAGYKVELLEHPDIQIEINGRTYCVECKRIFSKNSYVSNILCSKEQLEKNSLINNSKLGIVAIEVSRFFQIGDTKLVAQNIFLGNRSIESKIKSFAAETKREFFNVDFPNNIPFVFLYMHDFVLFGGVLSTSRYLNIQQTHFDDPVKRSILMRDFKQLDEYFRNKENNN